MQLAKRVRGQRSTHRPGGVGPARSEREPTIRSASPEASLSVAPAVASRAVEPPASVLAVAGPGATATARDLRPRTRLRSSGLDQKAAAETEWVTDDLRRIAVISAIMVAGLALAWVLLAVVGLGDFY
jgi:hypothetical protein